MAQSRKPEVICDGILDTALGAWTGEDAQRAPTGMIYVGPPPFDEADLLFVAFLGISGVNFAARSARENAHAPHYRITVTLTRDWPAWSRDNVEMRRQEDSAARELLRDADLLRHAILSAWGAGTLIDGYDEKSVDVRWGDLNALPALGTISGWTWEFQVDATGRV